MTRLYHKSEKGFALLWMMGYLLLSGLGDRLSNGTGPARPSAMLVRIALALTLLCWIRSNGLTEKYGLCRPKLPARRVLYYLPLGIAASVPLWNGVGLQYGAPETLLFVVDMCCVGLLEELLFRGLLFRALETEGKKSAMLASSLLFGLSHIVNLFNGSGQDALATAFQIVFAALAGLVLVLLFCHGASLIPCILFHTGNNVLAAFGGEEALNPALGTWRNLLAVLLILGGYFLYLARFNPMDRDN